MMIPCKKSYIVGIGRLVWADSKEEAEKIEVLRHLNEYFTNVREHLDKIKTENPEMKDFINKKIMKLYE